MINLNEIENEVRVEDKFKYKNYNCVVTISDYGYRAAYIILPSSHPLSHKEIYDLYDVECHGGITFSGNINKAFDMQGGSWIIGFDYDHYGDNYDLQAVKKIFGDKAFKEADAFLKTPIAADCHTNGKDITLESVKEELKKVIDQIDSIGKPQVIEDQAV